MTTHYDYTVLWAEDEAFYIGLVRAVIMERYERIYLAEARNGKEALNFLDDALLLNNLPRIIVLDINMPDMDGRKTLVSIITRAEFRNIPKVLFSSSNSLLDKLFSTRYNVPLVFKSADEAECKKTINSILDSYAGYKKNIVA